MQGERLATEVVDSVRKHGKGIIGRISFVAHSMGGIVVRMALTYLEEFAHIMGFFMTLSTPHLSLRSHQTALVSTGLWLFQKIKKSISL